MMIAFCVTVSVPRRWFIVYICAVTILAMMMVLQGDKGSSPGYPLGILLLLPVACSLIVAAMAQGIAFIWFKPWSRAHLIVLNLAALVIHLPLLPLYLLL
jgi:hypothetical protein